MHPNLYFNQNILGERKSIGVLLAGNFDERFYTNTVTKNFGLLDRTSIYESITNMDTSILISGDKLIKSLRNENYKFYNNIFVVDKNQERIKGSDWLYCLSSTKFLICPPGMIMPLCQNVIEALSVGTVPILNYNSWLNPSLDLT